MDECFIYLLAGVAEWQTRMFKGHVRKSKGSSPFARTR